MRKKQKTQLNIQPIMDDINSFVHSHQLQQLVQSEHQHQLAVPTQPTQHKPKQQRGRKRRSSQQAESGFEEIELHDQFHNQQQNLFQQVEEYEQEYDQEYDQEQGYDQEQEQE